MEFEDQLVKDFLLDHTLDSFSERKNAIFLYFKIQEMFLFLSQRKIIFQLAEEEMWKTLNVQIILEIWEKAYAHYEHRQIVGKYGKWQKENPRNAKEFEKLYFSKNYCQILLFYQKN